MTAHSVPLDLRDPLSLGDARDSMQLLSRQRRSAEQELRDQIERAAQAEADYRRALAAEFVKVDGTAAEREAKARANVADLSYKRDLQHGLVKACQERLQGLDGERASLHRLVEYSIVVTRATEAQQPPAFAGPRAAA